MPPSTPPRGKPPTPHGAIPHALSRRGSLHSLAVPSLWAHRGVSAHAPENSELAFALAIEDGADGVELDVRDAGCGTVVVAHDPTLERVAGREGVVAQMTAAALAEVELAGPGDTRSRGLPTLDRAIDQVLSAGLRLNVEIKGDVPDRLRLASRVAAVLARRTPAEREAIVVSSFRPEILVALRAAGARVPVGFLFDAENTGRYRAAALVRAIRPDGVHPQFRLADRASVARWKRAGLFVNVWTVDDEERLRILASHGVDGLITNDPARARAAFATADTAR
ncbi:MAG: glycerophosphodiester phosphodiesterase [Sandaracinaceae bacterium]|nr:glycerophosphodiester phosphodiesterase [Sandaracinaceae bacterium]